MEHLRNPSSSKSSNSSNNSNNNLHTISYRYNIIRDIGNTASLTPIKAGIRTTVIIKVTSIVKVAAVSVKR